MSSWGLVVHFKATVMQIHVRFGKPIIFLFLFCFSGSKMSIVFLKWYYILFQDLIIWRAPYYRLHICTLIIKEEMPFLSIAMIWTSIPQNWNERKGYMRSIFFNFSIIRLDSEYFIVKLSLLDKKTVVSLSCMILYPYVLSTQWTRLDVNVWIQASFL